MSARVSIAAQAAIVGMLLQRGVSRKIAKGREADMMEDQLRAAAETLRWVDRHRAAIIAAVGSPDAA